MRETVKINLERKKSKSSEKPNTMTFIQNKIAVTQEKAGYSSTGQTELIVPHYNFFALRLN